MCILKTDRSHWINNNNLKTPKQFLNSWSSLRQILTIISGIDPKPQTWKPLVKMCLTICLYCYSVFHMYSVGCFICWQMGSLESLWSVSRSFFFFLYTRQKLFYCETGLTHWWEAAYKRQRSTFTFCETNIFMVLPNLRHPVLKRIQFSWVCKQDNSLEYIVHIFPDLNIKIAAVYQKIRW